MSARLNTRKSYHRDGYILIYAAWYTLIPNTACLIKQYAMLWSLVFHLHECTHGSNGVTYHQPA